MADLTINLASLPPAERAALHQEFSKLHDEDMVKARVRQYAIARCFREDPPRFIEGVGEMRMALDPFWEKHFKMQFGVEPTRDREFQQWLRKNGGEEFFVKSVSARAQFGYAPPRRQLQPT